MYIVIATEMSESQNLFILVHTFEIRIYFLYRPLKIHNFIFYKYLYIERERERSEFKECLFKFKLQKVKN